MKDSTDNSSSHGIGFVGLLTIAFIVLRLTGSISWSWWWVLSPIWIPTLLVVSILIILGACWLIYPLIKSQRSK